jgi:hypothetical protein
MTPDDLVFALIMALLGGLLANAIELPIIRYWTRPERLMQRLQDPSPADLASLMAFFSHLGEYLVTPSMQVQVPGEARGTYQTRAPIEVFAGSMAQSVVAQIRGVMGSTEKEMQKLGGAMGLPMKGESTSQFLFRTFAQQIIPMVQDAAAAKVNEILKPKA